MEERGFGGGSRCEVSNISFYIMVQALRQGLLKRSGKLEVEKAKPLRGSAYDAAQLVMR